MESDMTEKSEIPDEEMFLDKEPKDPWTARPLTLEGTARLIQLIGGILGDAAERSAVQSLISKDGEIAPVSTWRLAMAALNKEKLAEFLSIIVRRSPTWVARNFSLLKASRAIGQFFEQEDFAEILKNLRPATGKLLGAENDGSPES